MSCADDQSALATQIPTELLHQIFKYAITDRKNLPTICNISKVCRIWYEVSTSPLLWQTIDLERWTKKCHANDETLIWIMENRLSKCKELNLGNWKIKDYKRIFTNLHKNCPNLNGIGLSGWKKFQNEHLNFFVENFKSLQHLDLSSIGIMSFSSRLSVHSICKATQILGDRLTQLNVSHNRIAGVTQLISDLCTHCPNLQLLDLSNVHAVHSGHGILYIEKMQINCPKLKVLRLANSDIMFNTAPVQEQLSLSGFPYLEQLSVASLRTQYNDLTDEILHRILKDSTKLKLLDIRGCKKLTYNALLQLDTDRLKHLFLSGCFETKNISRDLFQVISLKWKHTLAEIDFAWIHVGEPLDNVLKLLAEPKCDSLIRNLNLSGTTVSADAVKKVLMNCQLLDTINLSSCRSLQRGVKRLFQGPKQINELRESFGIQVKNRKIMEEK